MDQETLREELLLFSKDELHLLIADIAHGLTIVARGTYVAGTTEVANGELLRFFNELIHRITAAQYQLLEGDDLDNVIDFVSGSLSDKSTSEYNNAVAYVCKEALKRINSVQ